MLMSFYVLQTDDKGVFFSNVSDEYKLAAETFNLTRSELFEISIRSIDAVFGGDEIKNELKRNWLKWKEEREFQITLSCSCKLVYLIQINKITLILRNCKKCLHLPLHNRNNGH